MTEYPVTRRGDLRASDRDRAEAAERLSAHAAAGRLDVDELEARLEHVNAAVHVRDLRALEADLPALAAGLPRTWPWLPFSFALIAVGIAGSIAVGHPLVPLFAFAFFVFWRRAAWS
jgi:Domain of unknown function (DUF1707)